MPKYYLLGIKSPLNATILAHFGEMSVRLIGLEPTRPEPPDPKSGASTNSATSAFC